MSTVNNIYKSITTIGIRNNIDNESTTSSITLPSFQKRKVKKYKIEEFINKILSRDINSNEQFPLLNKTINNNFSDNISDESNSDDDSLPELSKRKQELNKDSEDEDSYEEIKTIIKSRKANKTYSQRKDQETKTKTLKIPSIKVPNPNNKSKRDKQ